LLPICYQLKKKEKRKKK